jgi:hypothetical protein
LRSRLIGLTTVTLVAVLAPPAMGAAVFPKRTCFRQGGPATFLGTGYGPGQPVAASLDGRQFVTGTATATGQVPLIIFNLPAIARSEQRRVLSITQTNNPAVTASISFTETQVYVVTKPSRFRPGRRLRIRAGGFYEAGPTLYGHVRGPKRRNLRIGRIKGACGKVSATKKVILKRGDGPGFYTVQFDTRRKYAGLNAGIRFRRAYTIRRIFRFSRTSSFSQPVMPRAVEGRIG